MTEDRADNEGLSQHPQLQSFKGLVGALIFRRAARGDNPLVIESGPADERDSPECRQEGSRRDRNQHLIAHKESW